MQEIHLHYLNAPDVEALALTNDEIIAAVESGLAAQGRREAVIAADTARWGKVIRDADIKLAP